jgi:hypothetical protein
MGPGPVLQYRPLKPTAPGACSDSVPIMTAAIELPSPPTTGTCLPGSTRYTCSCHPVCNAPSWRPDAGIARATAARPPPPQGPAVGRPLPPSLHAPHMQPPPMHLTPSLSVRRRSRSLLFPQLSSSSSHSARPRHRHLSPATIDHHLWCSSGPIDPTRSVARARRCSPTSPTEPATAGRPPHRRTPPPDRHRRHEPATVSLLPPFAPNQDPRRSGLLPGCFPADQRPPAGRIRPMSRRRRRGISLPCFLGWAEMPEGTGPLSRAGRALLWAEPKCTVHFLNYFLNFFELIQINSEFD